MPGVKLVVLYPPPKSIAAFEKAYKDEHLPMAVRNLAGMTKVVLTKIVGSVAGASLYHRVAEIHFPTMEALQACLASPGGQQTAAHAVKISTGGTPVFMVAEEKSFSFTEPMSEAELRKIASES